MVAIALDAIKTAIASRLHFDFFIHLSDADLALRTDVEMRAFLSRMRGRSLINVHEGGGPALMDATRFINAHTVIECGGYGFVVVNKTPSTFPLTHGCCIGRSGPAAFATLPLSTHELLTEKTVHTGSQWVVLAADFCRYVLDSASRGWLSAFERRLVPDESIFQTMAMHSPQHKRVLLNHNLRWIDWPHSHGDPNEYWGRLGSRKFVGGPRVLNSSELSDVLASPYMFARKVDIEVDPKVLRLWDTWMARKLAGEAPTPPQSPIGHSPGDPQLSIRFRAPGLHGGVGTRGTLRRRRVAMIEFEDGSRCGCADGCDAIEGGCCDQQICDASPPAGARDGSTDDPASDDSMDHRPSAQAAVAPPCLASPASSASRPGGDPLLLSWVNRARHPVRLSVLDYTGREIPMRTLNRPDETAAFNSHERVTWRARALNGELMLEHTPAAASGSSVVAIDECAFRFTGAAAVLAATSPDPTAVVDLYL